MRVPPRLERGKIAIRRATMQIKEVIEVVKTLVEAAKFKEAAEKLGK